MEIATTSQVLPQTGQPLPVVQELRVLGVVLEGTRSTRTMCVHRLRDERKTWFRSRPLLVDAGIPQRERVHRLYSNLGSQLPTGRERADAKRRAPRRVGFGGVEVTRLNYRRL